MQGKRLFAYLGAGVLLIIVFAVSSSYLVHKAREVEALHIQVCPIAQVNYNNYIADNKLDYKGNQFAWQNGYAFASKMTVLNSNGEYTVHSGITNPFQILDDCVVYKQGDKLLQRSLSNQQEQCIAREVSDFVATENAVFYLAGSTLFQHSWMDRNTAKLKDNIVQFYIHNDQLHVIDQNGYLMRLEVDGTWQDLCMLQITEYPFCVMPQGNFVISLRCNELVYTDIYTGATETICLSKGHYGNNRICFICDDQQLFVSFQATQTDGSIVRDIPHTDNGIWCVNFQTKQIDKLCNDTFDQLYLFAEKQLFGVKDNQLFQIDTEIGDVEIISN